MNATKRLTTFALTLIVTLGIAVPAFAGDPMQQLLGQFLKSYNAHDAGALQSMWIKDGRVITSGGQIQGAELIGERYRLVFGQLVPGETLEMRAEIREQWSDEDEGTAWGVFKQYHLGFVVDEGAFVLRAVKQSGDWKISRAWLLGGDNASN